jgi:hypothetical protein
MNYFYKKKKKRIIFKILKKLIAIFETIEMKVRNWIKNKKKKKKKKKKNSAMMLYIQENY